MILPETEVPKKIRPIEVVKSVKKSKKQLKEEALRKWWDREPWPCVILAIDPGRLAGASILISTPLNGLVLYKTVQVNTLTRDVESIVHEAVTIAKQKELHLVLVLETWGKGGNLGINQWIGLGESRGPWRREFLIRCDKENHKHISKSRVIMVTQNRWRSRVIKETGDRSSGQFKRFTPEQWKEVAHKTALEYFINTWVPPLDAAESACLGLYAARSDEVGSKLGKKYLYRHNQEFLPLEHLITR